MDGAAAVLKALVVRNPWAWCIARAAVDPRAKAVENRGRTTAYRGLLAIVAGKQLDYEACRHPLVQAVADRWVTSVSGDLTVPLHPWRDAPGAVLAVADLYDVCERTGCQCGPWAVTGQYHLRLQHVRALRDPVPVRGAQWLFNLPGDAETAVRSQLQEAAA